MSGNTALRNGLLLLLAIFAGSMAASNAFSQSAQATHNPATPASPARAGAPVHFVPPLSRRAQMYYEGVWGVNDFTVKYTESGEMIRFSWRVLDPAKAARLNDKEAEPVLLDPQAGVKLKVPQMEKVGKLRQSSAPIAGKSYWMAFSNVGRRVRPGDRVSVEIGQFRAINLVVE
jgi:hypothetical protein